jgi:hypothetical protein
MTSRIEGESVKQHDQTVDADAFAGGRGHAVFQGPDIILVEHRMDLLVAAAFGDLLGKTLALIDRVVQFTEGVGNLPAGDEQFETIGDRGSSSLRRASGDTSVG